MSMAANYGDLVMESATPGAIPMPGQEAPRFPSFDEVFGDRARAIPGGPGPGGPNDNRPKSLLDDIIDTLTGKKEEERKRQVKRQERLDKLTGKEYERKWREKEANKNASEFRPLFGTQNVVSEAFLRMAAL